MTQTVVNNFIGGMDKDVDKALLSNKKFLDAHNYRLITTTGNSSGSLENIKGNNLIEASTLIQSGQFIIGSCEIRDSIILFTTNNTEASPVGGRSMIYKLTVDLVTETQTDLELLYDDSLNVDDSYLLFSTANPIKAISRYETPNVQKIYWTDGFNNIRYINIANHQTVTGEVYALDGDYMSVDKFEFLPNFIVSKPTLSNIVGGKIPTGMVAYAYQLYIINGAETAISPLSDPIHVVTDNDFLSNTLYYNGEQEAVNSGKGFVIKVDNTGNDGYNRLRLIRVYYDTYNGLPKISIANEIEINTTGEIVYITDTGNTLGELTIDEFNLGSTELFKCQDIASKDNKLFVSNIEKVDYTVDTWDARAVRFHADATPYVYILDSTEDPVSITKPTSDTPAEWDAHGWSTYVANHDGINTFNNLTNDGDANHQFIYQSDGTTLGAEGPNIKIDFELDSVVIDSSNDWTTFHVGTIVDGTDRSYESYASPWKDGKLSWQRDEIYRLFIVFGNERGQTADPKWICDLRMPSLHDAGYSTLSYYSIITGDVHTDRLYPRVYLKSFPTNATWAQIYRVKRGREDRTVVTQGAVIPSHDYGSGAYGPYPLSTANLSTDGAEIIKLVSPEININRNISKQGQDFIEYVTHFGGTGGVEVTVRTSSNPNLSTTKYLTNTRIDFDGTSASTIGEAQMVAPALLATDYVMVDGKEYRNYIGNSAYSKGCTGLVVSYNNTSWGAEGTTYAIANYKSNQYGSQYGGYTYEDRANNISIPCSAVILSTDINTWVDVPYGDTYINYFDVTYGLADLIQESGESSCYSAYIPLESSINCDLRHDNSSGHLTYADELAAIRQEYMGIHDLGPGPIATYNQERDLYLYNTVYSQPLDTKYAISLQTDKVLETEFDCMVKSSNTKSNGEITDSWTKFGVNEFIELDSLYGPVNGIYNFNDRIVFFQDKAFGLLSINERSLISDQNAAQLVLGTGGVLDRATYMSINCGCKDKFSIVNSKSGLYWYDRLMNSIYRYSDTLMNLSRMKSLQSYLDNSSTITDGVFNSISFSNIKNDELLFTFYKNSATNGFTISYNELVDAFVSFYDFVPVIYIPFQFRYLTTTNTYYSAGAFNRNLLYLHESDVSDRCYFYGAYVNSTLKVLFNPDYNYTKVFDNLYYISNSYSSTTEIYDNTFSSVRFYNDFQNTDYVTLTPNTNLRRRERTWTLAVPRSVVNGDVSTNPDIFVDMDSAQLFKERMRDKYIIADFIYTNDGTYDRFVVSNIGMKYRQSIR